MILRGMRSYVCTSRGKASGGPGRLAAIQVANFDSRGGYELLRHRINRIPGTFVFGSETPAHPSFLCSIIFWLWRRRGMMLLVRGGVSLQDFLVLHNGLLNFLFEPCCLGCGKGGVFLGEFLS
jgi:hypothetical protein